MELKPKSMTEAKKTEQILTEFVKEVQGEFPEMNLEYLSFIKDRVVNRIPDTTPPLPDNHEQEITAEDILKSNGWYDPNVSAGNYRIPMPYVLRFMEEYASTKLHSLTEVIEQKEGEINRLRGELANKRDLLYDVVSELDLSEEQYEKHGPMGTEPSKLVRLVLDEKDLKIRALKAGMKDISDSSLLATQSGEIERLRGILKECMDVAIHHGYQSLYQKIKDIISLTTKTKEG